MDSNHSGDVLMELAQTDVPLLIDVSLLILFACFLLGAVVALALAVLQRAKEWLRDTLAGTMQRLRPTTTHSMPPMNARPRTTRGGLHERAELVLEMDPSLPIIE